MLILGIETATEQVACAVGGHEGVLAAFQSARGRRHAETLVPAIEFTCRQAQVDLGDLGAIAVDVGPGLFTGLRVGIATAKAMAQALRIPVVGIPSLDLLAFPVRFSPRLVAAVIDARRGEVFWALYRQVPGGLQRDGGYQVGKPGELAGELQALGADVLAVGDGAHRYRAHLTEVRGVEVADQWLAHPTAKPLVQLAHAKALREEFVPPSAIEPLYLRKPDAEINWAVRDSPGGAR